MGGTSSKSTVNILNKISVDASMRTVQSCSTSASQDQLIELETQGSVFITNVKLTQGTQINSKCIAQTQKQLELRNDISAAIAQFAEASGPAVLSALGSSRAEVETTIKNELPLALNMDTIQENITASLQRQKVKVKTDGNIFVTNLTMEQTAKVWAEAMVSDEQFASSITKIAAKIDQKAEAETTDPIANLVGAITKGLGAAIMLPIIIGMVSIVAIIILVLVIRLVSKAGAKGSSEVPLGMPGPTDAPSAPVAPAGTELFGGRKNIFGGWA